MQDTLVSSDNALDASRTEINPFVWHRTFCHDNLIMKIFLQLFFLFRRFKKNSCPLMAKECMLIIAPL